MTQEQPTTTNITNVLPQDQLIEIISNSLIEPVNPDSYVLLRKKSSSPQASAVRSTLSGNDYTALMDSIKEEFKKTNETMPLFVNLLKSFDKVCRSNNPRDFLAELDAAGYTSITDKFAFINYACIFHGVNFPLSTFFDVETRENPRKNEKPLKSFTSRTLRLRAHKWVEDWVGKDADVFNKTMCKKLLLLINELTAIKETPALEADVSDLARLIATRLTSDDFSLLNAFCKITEEGKIEINGKFYNFLDIYQENLFKETFVMRIFSFMVNGVYREGSNSPLYMTNQIYEENKNSHNVLQGFGIFSLLVSYVWMADFKQSLKDKVLFINHVNHPTLKSVVSDVYTFLKIDASSTSITPAWLLRNVCSINVPTTTTKDDLDIIINHTTCMISNEYLQIDERIPLTCSCKTQESYENVFFKWVNELEVNYKKSFPYATDSRISFDIYKKRLVFAGRDFQGAYHSSRTGRSSGVLVYPKVFISDNLISVQPFPEDEIYFGMEVELAKDTLWRTSSNMLCALMMYNSPYLDALVSCESDSSIQPSGVEFVFKPMTPEVLKFVSKGFFDNPIIQTFFLANNSTGIHIHVSKAGFKTPMAFAKWYRFMGGDESNRSLIEFVAERTSERYAKTHLNKSIDQGLGIILKDIRTFRRSVTDSLLDKYCAVRIVPDIPTYEVRIFSSSTNLLNVLKNIEFVWASIRFATFVDRKYLSSGAFIKWLERYPRDFSNLIKWFAAQAKSDLEDISWSDITKNLQGRGIIKDSSDENAKEADLVEEFIYISDKKDSEQGLNF